MLDKLRAVENRFEELCFKSEQPDFYNDPKKAAKLLRERNDLEPIMEAYRAYRDAQQEMEEALELMSDPEMKEFCQESYAAAKAKRALSSPPTPPRISTMTLLSSLGSLGRRRI